MQLNLKASLEAALFTAKKAISLSELAKKLSIEEKLIKTSLRALQQDYSTNKEKALELTQTKKNYYLLTLKKEYVALLKDELVFVHELKPRILKTLSLIFFEENILQTRVIKIRGIGAYQDLKALEELNWIKRKKTKNTYLISLTKVFLEYFELSESGETVKSELDKIKFSLKRKNLA